MATLMHQELSMYEEGSVESLRPTAFTSLLLVFLLSFATHTQTARAASSVTLAWDPSGSADVAGYNLYYGIASRMYTNRVNAGNATNVTISGLATGVTYFFAATAYDSFGIESDYSNETNYNNGSSGNTPPTISGIADQTIAQDTSTGPINFTVSDAQTPAGSLTVAATSSDLSLIPQTGIVFGGSGGNRTITLTPAAGKSGSSTINVSVSDGTATAHSIFTVTVQPASAPSVTIGINGDGKVTPDPSSIKFVAGHNYTFTAVPDSGQEFSGWTGDINSDSTMLTITVTNNIVLTANFVVSPYIPVAGTYSGLFYESDLVRQDTAGAFRLTVTTKGKYSGNVQLGGKRYAFSGKFTLGCVTTNSLKRLNSSPLTLHLRIGTNNAQIDQIFGDLSNGSWVSGLSGDRSRFNTRTNPAPAAGIYTLLIPGSFSSSFPRGNSYGAVHVSKSGLITYAGSLAEGSHLSQASSLSKHGTWPFYASLYAGTGSVLSWLTFTNQASSDVSGQLSWIKPANAKSKYFTNGFDYISTAAGSLFVPASATNEIFGAGIAAVDFSGGNLPSDFSNLVNIDTHGKVVNMSNNKLSMAFGLTTGIYHGLVTDPTTGHSMPFSGAVFQKINMGYGFLLGTNLSTSVELSQ